MRDILRKDPLNALLVGVQVPGVSDTELEGSLSELARLVTTLGYRVIGQTSQKRSSDRKALVLGEGKLKEIAEWTGGTGRVQAFRPSKLSKAAQRFKAEEEDDEVLEDGIADEVIDESEEEEDSHRDENPLLQIDPSLKPEIAIFDIELSPSQLRNLESALGVPVLDRTGVIIEIFSRHARTRAARLQVEIARLKYVAPRVRETGGASERQGGGVGGRGAGESSLELDRRKIRDRIKELNKELASISHESEVRRARRSQEITVALVGYTNAGKSSLMRALTGSDILVADKLFATLDTTVRLLYPESIPKILISDTVGFIKKLPHDLVASFKSTLDEATNASLLLHVVDSSDPTFRSQMKVTESVLAEVGAAEIPTLLILNKSDRLSAEDRKALMEEFPEAKLLSAHSKNDVATLRDHLIDSFEENMVDRDLIVPYTAKGAIGELRSGLRVLKEEHDERGFILKVRGHEAQLEKLVHKYGLIYL